MESKSRKRSSTTPRVTLLNHQYPRKTNTQGNNRNAIKYMSLKFVSK